MRGARIIPRSHCLHKSMKSNLCSHSLFYFLSSRFVSVPTVLYIFKGRAGQEHLQWQMKVMHTRVFGQFAVISMLLTLMGFKEYMDRNGKYITEADVQARVAQMQESRAELLMRLQRDRIEAERIAEKRRVAHEADLKKNAAKGMVKSA